MLSKTVYISENLCSYIFKSKSDNSHKFIVKFTLKKDFLKNSFFLASVILI